ncbi:MAG: IS1595 family transposase [Acidobacteriaceae bacterium]
MKAPQSLQEAIIYFADPDRCIEFFKARRWPNGVECPTCGAKDVRFIATRRMWECKQKHPRKQFSIKVGSIFEDSALGLDKWLTAAWLICNAKNGVSSCEIARSIRVTQKTAWFMLHRIRKAMQTGSFMKLGGGGSPVEVDETYIGGKVKNMHKERRLKFQREQRGWGGKAIVMGLLERNTKQVRAEVISDCGKINLHGQVRKHVEVGGHVISDNWAGYDGLHTEYARDVINHTEAYVQGQIHTNGIENFWSLLKRGLSGTYVNVEPFHLSRYVDEQVYRYNNRKNMNDAQRIDGVLSGVAGKRLTYVELIGKSEETRAF